MKQKIFLVMIMVGFALMQINCARIIAPGYVQRFGTNDLAKEGLLHSYQLAQECTAAVEALTQQNPQAEVSCRYNGHEFELWFDPDPPPRPESQNGLIFSSNWARTYVEVVSYLNGERLLHHAFHMEHGDRREIDLMPGKHFLICTAGTRRHVIEMNVDNEHGDAPLYNHNYDFYREIVRF
ncbi:hypothetical protein ACFL2U_00295 [Patescibacteria group bacterium]